MIGRFISQDFGIIPNLNNFTKNEPNATFTLSNGYLRIVNAGSGGFDNWITFDAYGSCQFEEFEPAIIVIPRDDGSQSNDYGVSIGLKNTNTTTSVMYQGFLELDSSASKGKVQIYKDGVAVGSKSAGLSFNYGDEILLTFNRNLLTYTVTALNLSSTSGTNAVSISFSVSQLTTSDTTNTCGKPCIWSNGGTQDIKFLTVDSKEMFQPDYVTIGDSILDGDCTNGVYNRIPDKAFDGTITTFLVSASMGNKTNEIVECLPELKMIRPKKGYIFMFGANDVVAGISQSVREKNYKFVRDELSKIAPVIHCYATPRNSTDLTSWNTFISNGFPSDKIITATWTDLKDAGTGLNSAFSADGTHLNIYGSYTGGKSIYNNL